MYCVMGTKLFISHYLSRHIIMKFLPSTKRIRKAREVFRKVIEEIVQDHVETFNPNDLRDYIDGYLDHAYKLDKSGEKHSFNSILFSVFLLYFKISFTNHFLCF